MQAQAQLSGAVRIRRLATSLARPGSGGGTVLCIELCLSFSTAARASSIYFSRPPQFLILIRQRGYPATLIYNTLLFFVMETN